MAVSQFDPGVVEPQMHVIAIKGDASGVDVVHHAVGPAAEDEAVAAFQIENPSATEAQQLCRLIVHRRDFEHRPDETAVSDAFALKGSLAEGGRCRQQQQQEEHQSLPFHGSVRLR